MMSLFKARVNIGCSALGRCAFITGTYKEGVSTRRDAGFVAADWKELWRRLPDLRKKVEWLRVMELTRKGTPHWHLVMGPIPEGMEVRCWSGKVIAAKYLGRLDECGCVAHVFSRAWYAITGDSWLVHATPVYEGRGPGAYMGKYLDKTFGNEERAKELGMKRRWSSSRGWPGRGRLRMAPTEEDGWREVVYKSGPMATEEVIIGSFTKVGDELTRDYFAKREKERVMGELKRRLNA